MTVIVRNDKEGCTVGLTDKMKVVYYVSVGLCSVCSHFFVDLRGVLRSVSNMVRYTAQILTLLDW